LTLKFDVGAGLMLKVGGRKGVGFRDQWRGCTFGWGWLLFHSLFSFGFWFSFDV